MFVVGGNKLSGFIKKKNRFCQRNEITIVDNEVCVERGSIIIIPVENSYTLSAIDELAHAKIMSYH